jgi:hypothetical protein
MAHNLFIQLPPLMRVILSGLFYLIEKKRQGFLSRWEGRKSGEYKKSLCTELFTATGGLGSDQTDSQILLNNTAKTASF